MTANTSKFESAEGAGSISTLIFDIDITAEPMQSDNPLAPNRAHGCSPLGLLVERGGIWKKQIRDTRVDILTIKIHDHGFNRNPGRVDN